MYDGSMGSVKRHGNDISASILRSEISERQKTDRKFPSVKLTRQEVI